MTDKDKYISWTEALKACRQDAAEIQDLLERMDKSQGPVPAEATMGMFSSALKALDRAKRLSTRLEQIATAKLWPKDDAKLWPKDDPVRGAWEVHPPVPAEKWEYEQVALSVNHDEVRELLEHWWGDYRWIGPAPEETLAQGLLWVGYETDFPNVRLTLSMSDCGLTYEVSLELQIKEPFTRCGREVFEQEVLRAEEYIPLNVMTYPVAGPTGDPSRRVRDALEALFVDFRHQWRMGVKHRDLLGSTRPPYLEPSSHEEE